MQRAGNQVVVISSDSNNLVDLPSLQKRVTQQNIGEVKLVWLKTMKYLVAKSPRRILSWLHFEWNLFWLDKESLPKPDAIIVSSLSILTIFNGLILRKKYGCRLIFEVRDIWPLTIIEEGGFSKNNPLVQALSWVEKIAYRNADAIVGTMPNLAEHVQSVLGFRRPTYCIPMGISQGQTQAPEELPESYKTQYLSSHKFKVVHAGTVGITNALDVFFKAAEALQSRHDIEFIILGDGALKAQYQNQYGHLPNLIFSPKVNRNAVQSVLAKCDLLYFSTHESKVWDYGLSLNKVIDYMMAAKPILASYGGYPSMINEADCGYFVPPNNVNALVSGILEMQSKKPDDRADMGARGRKWLLKNRPYSKLAQDYLAILFGTTAL
jgi:glycosyltransferase involved in cell wall biosynthesis